uniref:Uncharacterized protein n=1 Tax=Candidatus Kentrum sp. TC TaxID=2126339 RepID=A0A450YCV3_9GAMM|nr:MAG: hypothetical protein BECKTC1821D_GA0114238_100611 [Candidatus Kentron sp. TC]
MRGAIHPTVLPRRLAQSAWNLGKSRQYLTQWPEGLGKLDYGLGDCSGMLGNCPWVTGDGAGYLIHMIRPAKQTEWRRTNGIQWAGAQTGGFPDVSYVDRNKQLHVLCGFI